MNFILNKILEKIASSSYLSIVSRIRKADYVNVNPDVVYFEDKVAIVMQGDIINKDNFT